MSTLTKQLKRVAKSIHILQLLEPGMHVYGPFICLARSCTIAQGTLCTPCGKYFTQSFDLLDRNCSNIGGKKSSAEQGLKFVDQPIQVAEKCD